MKPISTVQLQLQKSWPDNDKSGLKTAINTGHQVVAVHAGGESGFLSDALLMFKSGSKKAIIIMA